MAQRHVIRLWGPWQVQALSSIAEVASWEGRINLKNGVATPPNWESEFLENFEGELILARRFNCPTGLDDRQRLILEIELDEKVAGAHARLNETTNLGTLKAGTQALDLGKLASGNQLQLFFEVASGGLSDFPIPPFRTMQLCIVD